MTLQKKDFIEIEFTGKTKEGQVFDSNVQEELEKLNSKTSTKPFIYSLGQDMFLRGIDNFLIGKEIGKYSIELNSEKAFGKRNPELIRRVPLKNFTANNMNPVPGMIMNFDGQMGRILSVSGGRVLVDLNHPVAGKDVIYNISVKRKITDLNEKINAFNDFLFKKEIPFKVIDKKVIYEVEKNLSKFIKLFEPKFKEVFDMDLEIKEKTSDKNSNN